MIANNDAELIAMISADMAVALTDVGDEMKDEIKQDVQSVVGVGSVYSPNGAGSLSEAWKITPAQGGGATVEVSMEYDSGLLDYNPSTFKHASPSEYVDSQGYVHHIENSGAIEDMASLVIEGGAGPLFGDGAWREPRDFWSIFEHNMDVSLDTWILNGMLRAGMPVV